MKSGVTQTPSRHPGYRKSGSRFADRLAGVFEQEALTDRDFIPNGKLDLLVTQKSVDQELSRIEYLPAYLRHRLWRKTHPRIVASSRCLSSGARSSPAPDGGTTKDAAEKNFQKIFAILVLIRRPEKIWAFVKEGVHDDDLPLCSNRTDTAEGTVYLLRRMMDSQAGLKCLTARSDVRDFLKRQWFVLAPSFNPSEATLVPRLLIANGEILPFLRWKNQSHRGGSGEIYRVTIHPDHHSFDPNQV
jgi:hypothetical protein